MSLDLLQNLGGLFVLAVLLGGGMGVLSSFGRNSAASWVGPALLALIFLGVAAACEAVGNGVGALVLAGFAVLSLAVKAVMFFRAREPGKNAEP